MLVPETDMKRQFPGQETDMLCQYLVLGPETDILCQFLAPEQKTDIICQFPAKETDVLCQFLGPETDPLYQFLGQQIFEPEIDSFFVSFWSQKLTHNNSFWI